MAAPRKTTSLLSWMPAQGTPGQRHARAALTRAFADVAALPEYRTGKVRAALALIAERAQAAYAARVADADAQDAPAPAAPASKARKARKANARKATASKPVGGGGKVSQSYCTTCRIPFRSTRKEHESRDAHKAAVAAQA